MLSSLTRLLLWLPIAILGGLLLHSLLAAHAAPPAGAALARALALSEARLTPSGDPSREHTSLPAHSLRHDPRLPRRPPTGSELLP